MTPWMITQAPPLRPSGAAGSAPLPADDGADALLPEPAAQAERELEAALRDPVRLAALHGTALLDSAPEASFDRLTQLAARLVRTPVALVSLVDDHRQFFKSAIGTELTGTPLSHSFCKHVVARRAPLIIDDARRDPLVCHNPAIESVQAVAYLGIPLTTPEGSAVGSLCAIDREPRAWSDEDVRVLESLAEIAMSEIALRLTKRDLEHSLAAVQASESFARSTVDALSAHLCILDERGTIIAVNRAWRESAQADQSLAEDGGVGANYLTICDAARGDGDAAKMAAGIRRVLAGEEAEFSLEYPCHSPRVRRWFAARVTPFSGAGPRRVVIAHEDITARQEAEAAARESARKLIELSRTAGMAEVATSVLHNVGNVLNSVNVSCTCLVEGWRKSRVASLGRIVTLLREHEGDLAGFFLRDPRGQGLPSFLAQLAGHLLEEKSSALAELGHLRKSVEHIKDIVARQQSYASAGGVLEKIPVHELIEDALHIDSAGLDRPGVEVVREFDPALGAVLLDRHKILQILVNLIGNAKYAMGETGAAGQRLTLRATQERSGSFSIAIIDQGVGIAPDQLTRIFQHGYTTKKDGHGFGLHASALSAQQMGGTLRVESAGRSQGATFTLELPVV